MRLIDADALIGALHNHAFLEGDDRSICYNIIQKQPTIDAVPVSWIKERIENAINAKQTLIAQMWLELIAGYVREKNERVD